MGQACTRFNTHVCMLSKPPEFIQYRGFASSGVVCLVMPNVPIPLTCVPFFLESI